MKKHIAIFMFVSFMAGFAVMTNAQAQIPQSERDALIDLYYSTDGDNWVDNDGWLDDNVAECDWAGVYCTFSTGNVDHVRYLSLSENGLSGPIPASIGDLSYLESVYLSHNQLYGSIPVEIGNLANLGYLSLWDNQLSGGIPSQIGDLSNLTGLLLGSNQLSGGIPTEIGNLQKLDFLSLHNNQLTGPIPAEIGTLLNLTDILLGSNQLSGVMPASLGNLAMLENLSVHDNKLEGPIPDEFLNLRNLTDLSICNNYLYTDNPDLSAFLYNIYGGDWVSCQRGTPSNWAPYLLITSITPRNDGSGYIDVQFTGTDPEGDAVSWFEPSTYCTYAMGPDFDVDMPLIFVETDSAHTAPGPMNPQVSFSPSGTPYNAVIDASGWASGEYKIRLKVEDDAGNHSNYEYSDAFNFDGSSTPTPTQIPDIERQALEDIYNSAGGPGWTNKRNWLGDRGTENTWYGVVVLNGHVQSLSLSYNNLAGELPASIGDLANLTLIDAEYNQLTGAIPSELGDITNLSYINFHNNQLTGEIPSSLASLGRLVYLNLSENELTGDIPSEIGNIQTLMELHLCCNNFTGEIPSSFGGFPALTIFSVYDNDLSGAIPSELGNLRFLQTLYLCCNNFTGTLPASLGNLSQLEYLHVQDNELEGPLPDELLNLTNLIDEGSDFCSNYFYTDNDQLREFLNAKQSGGNWENCQKGGTVNEAPVITLNSITPRNDGSGYIDIQFTGSDLEGDSVTWYEPSVYCTYINPAWSRGEPLIFVESDPAFTADAPMTFSPDGSVYNVVVDATDWAPAWYSVRLKVEDTAGNHSNYDYSEPFYFEMGAAGQFAISGFVANLQTPDRGMMTRFGVQIGRNFPGVLPDDIDGISISGPDGDLPYSKDDFFYNGKNEFSLNVEGSPEIGVYTFYVTSGGYTASDTDNQEVNRSIPIADPIYPPDNSSVLNNNIIFYWNISDFSDVDLYYRIVITDLEGYEILFSESGLDKSSYALEDGLLSNNESYRWRVLASDGPDFQNIQNASVSEWFEFYVEGEFAEVLVPSGSTQADFNMVSFDRHPYDPSPEAVFGDDMGAYDTENFRIGTYDPLKDEGGYREYGIDLGPVEPGKAYWIFARHGLNVTNEGEPVSLDEEFEIELPFNPVSGDGWSMIGPPNNATYMWDDLEISAVDDAGNPVRMAIWELDDFNPYIDLRVWRWRNGTYVFYAPEGSGLIGELEYEHDPDPYLNPKSGYWVKAKQENVRLIFTPHAQTGALIVRSPAETPWTGIMKTAKRLLKPSMLLPNSAVAYSGDAPPAPMGGFSDNSAPGGVDGDSGGCFIESTLKKK